MSIAAMIAIGLALGYVVALGWLWFEARSAQRRTMDALVQSARVEAALRRIRDRKREIVARRLAGRN